MGRPALREGAAGGPTVALGFRPRMKKIAVCSLRGVSLDSVWSRGSLESTRVVWRLWAWYNVKGRMKGGGGGNPVRSSWGMCA